MRDFDDAERTVSAHCFFGLAMTTFKEFKRMLSTLDLTFGSLSSLSLYPMWGTITHRNHGTKYWVDIWDQCFVSRMKGGIPITSAHSLSVSWLGLSLVISVHNLWGTSIKAATTSSAGDQETRNWRVVAENAPKLWQLVPAMDKFGCRDVEAVEGNLDDQKEETRKLLRSS